MANELRPPHPNPTLNVVWSFGKDSKTEEEKALENFTKQVKDVSTEHLINLRKNVEIYNSPEQAAPYLEQIDLELKNRQNEKLR